MSEWQRDLTRGSKFLSLVLRHAPERAGLELDRAGWAPIDAVLSGAQRAGVNLTRDQLRLIVDTNPKRRFAIDLGTDRIRAVQGHSVAVELGYEPTPPPEVLFHGTTARGLAAILHEGLKPMGRQHVHLSIDEATARTVGARHGRPVILRVDAKRMHADAVAFWQAPNGVWLCESVEPSYLTALRRSD